jgi:hypothetical protein
MAEGNATDGDRSEQAAQKGRAGGGRDGARPMAGVLNAE